MFTELWKEMAAAGLMSIKKNLIDIEEYAKIKCKDINVFIETPFGDSKTIVKPSSIEKEELEAKYGSDMIFFFKNLD